MAVKLVNIPLVRGYNSISPLGQLQSESLEVKWEVSANTRGQLLQNALLANVPRGKYLWRSQTAEALLVNPPTAFGAGARVFYLYLSHPFYI